MKVLVAHFTSESNAHVKTPCEFEKYIYKTGNEMIDAMDIRDIFEEVGVEIIPTIYANGHAGGQVTSSAFEFISSEIIKETKKHYEEIDGIYLYLHGASSVIGLQGSSGEHYILNEIRNIVGKYLPIAVVMDPHGNLSQEFADNANIIRCYRQSPHTDRIETQRIVAKMLVDLMKNRRNIHPVYRKIPILLGGERCVSTDEPMLSINKLLDEIEKDHRIMSCSYHIGYLRHDDDKCGASVIVVPNQEKDTNYANEAADKIAEFVWSKRHQFHFTGVTGTPEESIEKALKYKDRPAFITDSGDNTTSGAPGYNTFVLRQFMDLSDFNNKKVLIAAITDPAKANQLAKDRVGDEVIFDLGVGEDSLSQSVKIHGIVKAIGCVHNIFHETANVGAAVTVTIKNKPVDVIVTSKSITYAEIHQFEAANINIDDYDIIVVKQGYIFPELKEKAKFHIMSLTEGPTDQRTERISYKRILRPMFPIDNI
jgi:Uncharacterized conserved protein